MLSLSQVGDPALTGAAQDTDCSQDYVGIEGSSDVCCNVNAANLYSKYCGRALTVRRGTTTDSPICGEYYYMLGLF